MALKIDTEIVKSAMTEVIMQNIVDFNTATNGGIVLSTEYFMGDAVDTSMIKEIANLITERDPTDDLTLTAKTLDSVDSHNFAIYFTTGVIEFKRVDARRYGSDVAGFSNAIGEQVGTGFVAFMLNACVHALRGAIGSNSTLITGTGVEAPSYNILNDGLALFGDKSSSIVAWVMSGLNYHALNKDGITNVITDGVASSIVQTGATPLLGRNAFVTDSAGLAMPTGTAIIGVTQAGARLIERVARDVWSDIVGGKTNLKEQFQGEGEGAVFIKGYTFTAPNFPSLAILGTAANWSKVATDNKSTAGIIVNVA